MVRTPSTQEAVTLRKEMKEGQYRSEEERRSEERGVRDALRKILDKEVGFLSLERRSRVRGAGGENNAAGGLSGSNSSRGVLDDDT